MDRRDFLKTCTAVALVPLLGSSAALAQAISNLQITIPTGPGGGWDTTGRAIDGALREAGLISASKISNIAGAGGTIGLATFVNQSKGNANAILIGGMVMVTNIISNKSPVDLSMVTPIARLTGEYEAIAVPADSPYKDLASLMADFKADPAKVSWVGGSAGGTDHIVAALIAQSNGLAPTDLTYIGYPSGGEIQAAVLGGQATAGVSGLSEFVEHVASGGMRLLGITAPERVPGIDVPTLKEQGIDVDVVNWRGVFAPPGVSPEEKAVLLKLIDDMAKSEPWLAEVKKRNWTSIYLEGDEFGSFVSEEAVRITDTLQKLGLA